MAPWLRAPLLLLRRPGVAFALVAAAFVAALPAATAAPFLSSAANATLHTQIGLTCPASVGAVVSYDLRIYDPNDYSRRWPQDPPPRSTALATDDAVQRQLAQVAAAGTGLAAPVPVWHATDAKVQVGDLTPAVTSMTLPNFERHVHAVSGPSGSGVWIPDGFASAYHLKVGDPLVYTSSWGPPTKVRVAAVYQDLRSDPNNPAFCSLHSLIFGPPGAQLANNAVPPVILMDHATFVSGVLPFRGVATMNFVLANPKVSVEAASRVTATIANLSAASLRLFSECPGCRSATSTLPAFMTRSELARSGIKPTVLPITIAGVLVGLVVVAAAAVFWVLRRRQELTVLSAHGMGAVSLGVKAVLEALPALAVGATLAWVGAWWLVHAAGPDPHVAGGSVVDALLAAAAALIVAVVVVGVAAALRCRTLTDEHRVHHRLRLARWPWELLVIGVGIWAAIGFGSSTVTRDTPGGDGGLVVQVPPKLLIVPLLITVGCLMLLGRLVVFTMRRTSARGRRSSRDVGRSGRARSMVWFLGWHRIVREAAIVAVLAGATALPIALATYGDAVTRSVQATVDGEAKLLIGADVVVALKEPVPIPAALRSQATEVLKLTGVTISGNALNLYAVDPKQFSDVAFWNDQIDGASLGSILAPLAEPHQPGTPYPAVSSGNVPEGVHTPIWGNATDTKYDIKTVETLPAQQGGYMTLIVPTESLGNEASVAVPQLWIRGDPTEILSTLASLHLPIAGTSTFESVYSNTVFEPLTYTFQYLTALSILTGMVTIVGLLLYVEARAPGHRRGYVIAQRMGMRSGSHRRALLVELAVPLLGGLGLGLAVALSLTYAFSAGFDVDPTLPPHTLIDLPEIVIIGIAVAVAVVAVLASSFAQLRVGRASPSEVLRDTL